MIKNKILKLLLLSLSLVSFIGDIYGQLKLNGVIQSEKDELLAFSTISIKNTSTGTIANQEGRFALVVPSINMEDTLVISMTGFRSQEVLINNLKKSEELLFTLEEKVLKLEEVVILSDKLTAEELLKMALKKQKDNGPNVKYALDLFVRELFFLNDSCYAVVESAAQLFGHRILTPKIPIYLDQVRSASKPEPTVETVFERYNPFREFRFILGRKFRFIEPCADCMYEIEDYTYIDEQQAVIISVKKDSGEPNPFIRFVIGLSDYGIFQFEFHRDVPFGLGFPNETDSIASSLVSLHRTIDFQKFEDTYFLKSYRQVVEHEYLNMKDSSKFHTQHIFTVFANSITKEGVEDLKKAKNQDRLMDYRFSINDQMKSVDSEFWKNYNIVKRTSRESQYFDSLNKISE